MYYSGPICVKLHQVSGDVVPLHHLRGLGGVCGVCGLLTERQPPSQEGETQGQPGRGRRQCPRALLFDKETRKEGEPGPCLPVPEY